MTALRQPTVKWPGIFFKSIFLKNFFGFVISTLNVNEKIMKVDNLETFSKKSPYSQLLI